MADRILRFLPRSLKRARERYTAICLLSASDEQNALDYRIAVQEVALAERDGWKQVKALTNELTH